MHSDGLPTIGQTAMLASTLLLALALLVAPPDSTATPPASTAVQLMNAVHAYVSPLGVPGEDVQVRTEWTDLTGDGIADALVYLDSPSWCGSGGCTVLVFEAITGEADVEALGAFRAAAEISMMHGPVGVATTHHEGWADLIVQNEEGSRVTLRFDGETYPLSPASGVAYRKSGSETVLFATAE